MAKNGSDIIITIISIGLVVCILSFLFLGCFCFRKPIFTENFVVSDKNEESPIFKSDKPGDSALSPSEKELFEDLKNNKVSDKEINSLIQKGTLNEGLIEKMLSQLGTQLGTQLINPNAKIDFSDGRAPGQIKEDFINKPIIPKNKNININAYIANKVQGAPLK